MNIKKSLLAFAVMSGVLISTAAPAFAEGNGYAPPGNSGTSTTTTGFSTVLAAKTVGSSGATLNSTSGQSNVSVDIPSGTFSNPIQVSLTGGNPTALTSIVPSGDVLVTAFGVNFSGATPSKPITLTIANPNIVSGSQIFKVTSNGLTPVKSTVTPGKVTITFQNDPDFVVVTPKSGSVVGATSPVTGLPIYRTLSEGIVIAVLGSVMIFFSVRKRKSQS